MQRKVLFMVGGLAWGAVRCGARSQLIQPPFAPIDAADNGPVIDVAIDVPIDARLALDADAGGNDADALLSDAEDVDSAIDSGVPQDARLDEDVRVDGRADANAPFEIRDETFLAADWTGENLPRPFCSTDYATFVGGNDPRSEPVSNRGNPPSGWRLRTGPIANSAERCTHWIDAYHRRSDVVLRNLCRYEISFDHRVEDAGLWNNGTFESPIPGSGSAVFGVVASAAVRLEATLRAGPAASSRVWNNSLWQLTRQQLAAAGVGVGSVLRFGARAGNSTNVDQSGIGYFVDNTIDRFVVLRFVDPNDDGDCSDAIRG